MHEAFNEKINDIAMKVRMLYHFRQGGHLGLCP
jgi:hypothetical protein